MRILIVSVTTGYGHHSTAAALANEFKSRGSEPVVLDLYEYCSPFMYNVMDKGYLFSTNHLRHTYSQTYTMMETSERLRKFAATITSNSGICNKFSQYFHDYSPDVVIATHVLAAQVLNKLKAEQFLKAPVIGINTDYCIQPLWEDLHNIDYIVTPSELLNSNALDRGISMDKLLPIGLPVKPAFKNKLSKQDARLCMKIPDRNTILIMGGSMGYGNIYKTVKELLESSMDFQILCVCGNNQKLKEKLDKLNSDKLIVYGFVNNVELFMDASDCIITKPGGLTLTEILVKQLPAILVDPIPGHEERNIDFVSANGGAIKITDTFTVSEAIHHLFSDTENLKSMEDSLGLIAKPNATEDICDFVANLVSSSSRAE